MFANFEQISLPKFEPNKILSFSKTVNTLDSSGRISSFLLSTRSLLDKQNHISNANYDGASSTTILLISTVYQMVF